MMLNERVLQVVLTLAEELHFGRAAARLHVSQPALSATVRSLEGDLGVRLFQRTSRHVELTDAGRVFVTEARHLIDEGQRAISLIRESARENLGPLRIGYPASIDLRWLCSLVSDARREVRLTADLQMISKEGVHLLDELRKRSLHAAFFAGQVCQPDLQFVTFSQESFRVVLGARHPLAQFPALRFDQLTNESVVWLRREVDPVQYDSFLALCSAQCYRPRMAQAVGTFHECLEFARAGLGITFLPSFLQSQQADDTVVFASLPEGTLHADYGLAYIRDNSSRDVERFVKFVQHHAPKIDRHG